MGSKVIMTDIPKMSDLQYFIAVIDPKEEKDPEAPSDFQWQILKTRFLIWRNPDILAAPVEKRTSQIHVIISKDAAHEISDKFKNEQLVQQGPYKLEEWAYQDCMNYTLNFRIAPQWQKVSNFYLYSNEFLTSEEPMEGIQFQAEVSGYEGQLTMNVSMHRVKLPLLNLDSINVDMNKLKTTGFANIHATVYILPKLTRGTAVNLSVRLSDGCPFKSYPILRKHWKNTYGYRLPYDEEGMLYVGVNFGWNNMPYSYPIVCVRSGKLHQLKSKEPDGTLFKFGDTIMQKMPNVCGKPINIYVRDNGATFPLSMLQPEGQEVVKIKKSAPKKSVPSKVTKKKVPTSTPFANFEEDLNIEEIETSVVTDDVDDITELPFTLGHEGPAQIVNVPRGLVNINNVAPKVDEPIPKKILTLNNLNTPYKPSAFVSTTSTPLASSTSLLRNISSFVPSLSPIQKEQPLIIQTAPPASVTVPAKPVLKPVNTANILKRPMPLTLENLKSAGLVLINNEPPSKQPAPITFQAVNTKTGQIILLKKVPAPNPNPNSVRVQVPSAVAPAPARAPVSVLAHPPAPALTLARAPAPALGSALAAALSRAQAPAPTLARAPAPAFATALSRAPAPAPAPTVAPTFTTAPVSLIIQRPQNQGSEFDELAHSKNLHKLTVPVLKTFCQQNYIYLTCRDKKDAIIQKIYDHFRV